MKTNEPGKIARKRRLPGRPVTYPALLLVQNRHRFYFATIPVDDLFDCCFVARRDEDPKEGFQRTLQESRAEDIAKYLAAGAGSIPSNIVLSAQEGARFVYTRRTKSISFARTSKAFLVLDGQHRLWGYEKCEKRHRVPVAIYEALTRADEAKIFIDINTTQRGVPAALLLDIKHLAEVESTREQTLRTMFDRLNSDPKSPLSGRLSPAASVVGKISRVTFNRAIGPILSGTVLTEVDRDQRFKLIQNYLSAVEAELSNRKLLYRSAFFEAVFSVFDEAIRNTITLRKDAKTESIQSTIRSMLQVEFQGTGDSLRTKAEIAAAPSLPT